MCQLLFKYCFYFRFIVIILIVMKCKQRYHNSDNIGTLVRVTTAFWKLGMTVAMTSHELWLL